MATSEEQATETVPLTKKQGRDPHAELLVSVDFPDEKHCETINQDTECYDHAFVVKLNRTHRRSVVLGYLRRHYTATIHSYSIPVDIISAYYNNSKHVFVAKYLQKSDFFINSLHIDSNYVDVHSQTFADEWCDNLTLRHQLKVRSAVRSMCLYLALIMVLVWIAIILYTFNTKSVSVSVIISSILVLPPTVLKFYILHKTKTRKYRIVHFNVHTNCVQEWLFAVKGISVNDSSHSVCQVVSVKNVCTFNELRRIHVMAPYMFLRRDNRGNITEHYSDGALHFVTHNRREFVFPISYHSQWNDLYGIMEDIMCTINKEWFGQIEWSGYR